ncbi:hypothetical protein [Actinacidiphila glaucinigra]|uniref:Uncharacterized protein n=1 Tax=Actinacidiphila glaucinigra TaxID=235986 RepID=A0A239LRU2_9ACTN|nr:hypothetical protein [Actinacidiphila glaucinigra]SNT32990.1 hypothetical protein SAMN05216252_12114 [Actinacidiphila glaucinigra]
MTAVGDRLLVAHLLEGVAGRDVFVASWPSAPSRSSIKELRQAGATDVLPDLTDAAAVVASLVHR